MMVDLSQTNFLVKKKKKKNTHKFKLDGWPIGTWTGTELLP